MKFVWCLVLLWYFHSNHKLNALTGGRDPMRSGDPEGPFFAGRGRRGDVLLNPLQSNGDPSDSAGEINDARHFIGSESKLRLVWPFTLPWGMERPSMKTTGSSNRHMPIPTLDESPAYYIWYNNIRKKQSNNDPDDSPFMAVRG